MKKEIVIDTNNLYVRTLMKLFNEFMLEEVAGCVFTENRLKNKITQAALIFEDERKQLIAQNRGNLPMFNAVEFSKFNVVFKQ
ncbi:hypothetical protein CLV62_12515 [Dysgonomonas alginatilytica]|uniref:Uncharacterized protein n=1 Tax=Dysgonomonas alginatilytica TaxID=1605892 RepID=A0A2V3PJZ1_9BACT|nr:hypothetical protein [Dysgonomonas alginatilytica]PXV61182.1 hypothetical protein CLV62_12515 [Dysgonomonas alginatilytica]